MSLALALACAILFASPAMAASRAEELAAARAGLKYRLDLDYVYEHLNPNDDYGDWHSGYVTFMAKVHPKVTPFAQVGLHTHEIEGEAFSWMAGTYVDWFRYLSTYTALSGATESLYTPMLRIDHNFIVPLDPVPVNITLGGGFIDYWDDHQDWYLCAGPSLYLQYFIAEYLFFRSESDPGSVESYSHELSLSFGADGLLWVTLSGTVGAQAYIATNVPGREMIDQDAWEITLAYQQWIGKQWGLKAQGGYMQLGDPPDDGFEKWSVGAGAFIEW